MYNTDTSLGSGIRISIYTIKDTVEWVISSLQLSNNLVTWVIS